MSEEKVELPVEESSEQSLEEPQERPDLNAELQELGHQLTAATRAVLASPEAKDLRAQLQKGLESLEKTAGNLANQARETKVGQKVEASVAETSATVRERRILEIFADSVASALRSLNTALGQAVEKAEAHAEQTDKPKSAPQQIDIVESEEEE
jgi:hypothetical protein